MSENQVVKTTEKQLGGATGKGFKPGQCGNPNGRPKGKLSLVGLLKKALEAIPEGEDKRTKAELLIETLNAKAITSGDVAAIKEIFDRVDGRVPLKVAGDPENPLIVQVINYGTKENNNSTQLPAKVLPDAIPAKPGQIQDSSVPQEGGEKQDCSKPADSKDTVEKGDLLLHTPNLPTSKASDMGQPNQGTPPK